MPTNLMIISPRLNLPDKNRSIRLNTFRYNNSSRQKDSIPNCVDEIVSFIPAGTPISLNHGVTSNTSAGKLFFHVIRMFGLYVTPATTQLQPQLAILSGKGNVHENFVNVSRLIAFLVVGYCVCRDSETTSSGDRPLAIPFLHNYSAILSPNVSQPVVLGILWWK